MQLPRVGYLKGWKTCLVVTIADIQAYFSLDTPVAYRIGLGDIVVCGEGHGKTTTFKHLDAIDGGSEAARKKRLDWTSFQRQWHADVSAYLENGTPTGGSKS